MSAVRGDADPSSGLLKNTLKNQVFRCGCAASSDQCGSTVRAALEHAFAGLTGSLGLPMSAATPPQPRGSRVAAGRLWRAAAATSENRNIRASAFDASRGPLASRAATALLPSGDCVSFALAGPRCVRMPCSIYFAGRQASAACRMASAPVMHQKCPPSRGKHFAAFASNCSFNPANRTAILVSPVPSQ